MVFSVSIFFSLIVLGYKDSKKIPIIIRIKKVLLINLHELMVIVKICILSKPEGLGDSDADI